MRASRVGMTAGLAVLSAAAIALPSFTTPFNENYKVKKGSSLDKAGCAVCHVGKSMKLNPYGLDLKTAIRKAKVTKLTPEVLKQVEELDSDKDGAKNLDEIKADALPGDPKVTPPKKQDPPANPDKPADPKPTEPGK